MYLTIVLMRIPENYQFMQVIKFSEKLIEISVNANHPVIKIFQMDRKRIFIN